LQSQVQEEETKTKYVGQSIRRIDSLAKVLGSVKYCYDIFLPGMLYGAIVTSPVAHAKIKRIDATAIEKIPGLKIVITADDVPDRRKGQLFFDRPVITRKARYVGDIVAVVAAETQEKAYDLAKQIKVEYEELSAVFDVTESFKKEPPTTIHEDLHELSVARSGHPLFEEESPFIRGLDKERPNVFSVFKGEVGNVSEAFQHADFIIQNEYATGRIYHAAVEPHVAIADANALTGEVTIWSSVQCPYRAKMELCFLFDLDPAKVNFVSPYVGGGFGSKSYLTVEDLALALALKAGRPVRLAFGRTDDFVSSVARNPTRTTVKDAVMKDGTIVAREMQFLFDAGAYNDATFKFVTSAIYAASAAYAIPNFKFESYGVYTNTPICGAFRGFGIPQVIWAIERQMDLIADSLRMDPVDVRRKNLVLSGYVNPLSEEDVGNIAVDECLNKVLEAVGYHERKAMKNSEGSWRNGIGVSICNKPIHMHRSSAHVKVHSNGDIEIRVGVQEIGTGSTTALAQIAAEVFKTPVEKVILVTGDTRLTPYDEGTAGSRVTAVTGSAVLRASEDALRKVFEFASKIMKEPVEELNYEDGQISVKRNPSKRLHVSNLFHETQYGIGTMAMTNAEIIGSATYDLKAELHGSRKLHQSYTYGAQAAEIRVNVDTGKVVIDRIVTAIDVGKAINPRNIETQVEGGVAMGIGSALYEEMVLNDKGELINDHFLDYKIPTPVELPSRMETIIVETKGNYGPFGAKAVGEFPAIITAQTIASAIYDAIGVQFKEIPITQEKIVQALSK